jgi:hypothetical protein
MGTEKEMGLGARSAEARRDSDVVAERNDPSLSAGDSNVNLTGAIALAANGLPVFPCDRIGGH